MSVFERDYVSGLVIPGTYVTIGCLQTIDDCDQATVLVSMAIRDAHFRVAVLKDRRNDGEPISNTALAELQNDLAEARTMSDLIAAKRRRLAEKRQ